MILFKKVVSQNNIFKNKSHWLYTLPVHTIWKQLVGIGQEFIEISLNHMDFFDFSDKEMLASFFSFSSTNFLPLCYLKWALLRLKNYEFCKIFHLWPESIGSETLMSWIL